MKERLNKRLLRAGSLIGLVAAINGCSPVETPRQVVPPEKEKAITRTYTTKVLIEVMDNIIMPLYTNEPVTLESSNRTHVIVLNAYCPSSYRQYRQFGCEEYLSRYDLSTHRSVTVITLSDDR